MSKQNFMHSHSSTSSLILIHIYYNRKYILKVSYLLTYLILWWVPKLFRKKFWTLYRGGMGMCLPQKYIFLFLHLFLHVKVKTSIPDYTLFLPSFLFLIGPSDLIQLISSVRLKFPSFLQKKFLKKPYDRPERLFRPVKLVDPFCKLILHSFLCVMVIFIYFCDF